MIQTSEIKPYIMERSEANGFDFYRYLHIRGGSGNIDAKGESNRYGGEYNFILFYCRPEEMEERGQICERLWCREKGIVYGEGNTIEEAYENYKKKLQ